MLNIKRNSLSEIEVPERVVPERDCSYLVGEHRVRYLFARGFVEGQRVLDLGCGSGYGTNLLSQDASWAVGADISSEAVNYASEIYSAPNAVFVVSDACCLSFKPETFDIICAFEVIEHVEDQRGFLREAKRLLRSQGVLIVSTPNKKGDHSGNPYHVRELDSKEFKELLEEAFRSVKLYSEVRRTSLLYSILTKMDKFNFRKLLSEKARSSIVQALKTTPFDRATEKDFAIIQDYTKGHDLIGVCRKFGIR